MFEAMLTLGELILWFVTGVPPAQFPISLSLFSCSVAWCPKTATRIKEFSTAACVHETPLIF